MKFRRYKSRRLTFSDGSTLETDMVVMAAGIKPNHKLAETSGIEVNRELSSMISWKQVSADLRSRRMC